MASTTPVAVHDSPQESTASVHSCKATWSSLDAAVSTTPSPRNCAFALA